MKPSVQDATHYNSSINEWYKIGESTSYYWNEQYNGWRALTIFDTGSILAMHNTMTTQEALERGYKYPQYHGTTEGVIVDSTPSGEVLELYGISTSDALKRADDFCKKWSERINDLPDSNTTYRKIVDDLYDDCHRGPYILVNEPLIPDMTEANDKRVNTTSANNRQVGGDHYKKMKIQPWDLFGSIFNLDEQVGFYLGNVYKYLMRYDSKNGIQDLEKAKHYLEKLIEVKRGAASADVTDKR